MKQFAAVTLLTALVGYGVWWLVYEMRPATMLHDCAKSHTTFAPVVIGKVVQMQPRTHCDEYGPWYPNPRYAEWLKRHPGE